jgi:N4-gp56 family major capsid protein
LAGKFWSKSLQVAVRDNLDLAPLIGKDANSVIQEKDEMKKGFGDQVTFGIRMKYTQDGIGETDTAEGQGEALTTFHETLTINELGSVGGGKSENTIDQQRVGFDIREEVKDNISLWWAERWAKTFFNHVCGYTPETNLKYTGNNATRGNTATRRIIAGGQANDQALTANDVFSLDLLDKAKELAMVGDNMVRPIMVKGQKKYLVYLHPYQVTSIRTNSSTGQWLDITKSAMQGGQVADSPIYTGALGEYNGMVLRQSQDVTLGVNSVTPTSSVANTRRAVLLGAQAAVVAYGQGPYGGTRYRWNEELLDHKRKIEVGAFSIFGMKKVQFNSVDYGALTISSYAAPSA